MSERITVPIPESQSPTKIEVYHNGKLNRHGGVQPGATEASIKIPAPLEECEIRIIPCDTLGNPSGRGHVYQDSSLVPEPPVNIDPPAQVCDCEDECCGVTEDRAEVTEIVPDASASVVVERPEVDEIVDEVESKPWLAEGYNDPEDDAVEDAFGKSHWGAEPEDAVEDKDAE